MQFETWLHTDLQKPLNVVELDTSFFTQDEDANIIGVEITDNGTPVELTGNVHGYIISASGTTVPIDGTKSGNRAQITLNKNCYLDPGGISIAIKIGMTTVAACHGYVHRTETDTVVDPDHIIPSITEIIEQIRLCEQATEAANTATQNANQATTATNTATQNANRAAAAIDGLTTHAQNGQQSGAVVSTIDGHKHIEFTFPTVIPDLSDVETNTLTPGSNASVVIDTSSPYSLEAPHLTFNIPQGETGTITNASGMSIPISESDSTKIKTYIDTAIQSEKTARGLVEQRVETLEQNALTVDAVIDALYPVGSTYISMNSSMPTAITTGRTWTPITGDYVLRTITSGTGGTLSNAGNTGSTALTVAQIPSHRHQTEGANNVVTTAGTAGGWVGGSQTSFPVVAQDTYTSYTGSGQGHTHTAGMPKNVAVYMWRRTA